MIFTLFLYVGCPSPTQQYIPHYNQIKAERKLFKKSSVEIKSPKTYLKRETANGKEYDPRPRIVPIDEKAGKYELRWIGYDGKQKVIEYQRQDAIDGLVEAQVEKQSGNFTYKYLISIKPSSPTFLSEFIVQTFSSDIRDEFIPTGDENLHIGQMSNHIPQFSDGVWRVFAPLGQEKAKVAGPGKNIEFRLVSFSLPGVVNCNAGAGEITLIGVGEHMPSELEMAMPGFDELATCLTIGPVERLSKMSKSEKEKYILDNLPKFVEAGWMAGDTPKIYESILKRNDLAGAFEQAKKDLELGFITTEVFHIIEGLNY